MAKWMKRLLILLMFAVPANEDVRAEGIAFERFGLYVIVDDVAAARAFYERLFAREAQMSTPDFVGFEIEGGLYAIVSRRRYAPDAAPGNAVRPYIKVENIDGAFAHAKAITSRLETDHVVNEGPFRFFRIRDPEGNVLEFFSYAARP